MSIRVVHAALVLAVLLGSCSSPADVRPEVAQPLNEARVIANSGSDKAAIMAKLNQAASVPNLNSAERHQIRITGKYALARVGNGSAWNYLGGRAPSMGPDYSQTLGYTGLRDSRTY